MNNLTGKTRSDEAADAALGLAHSYRLGTDPKEPVFILIHGRAGDASVMWTFQRTIPESASVIAVQAPLPDAEGGFSWWDVHDTEGQSAQRERSLELLRTFIHGAPQYYALTPKTVIAYGFSQGAVLLSRLFQREPRLLGGAALLAGMVAKHDPAPDRFPPVFMAHGSNDQIVPVERAREGAESLRRAGATVEYHEEPVGHKIGAASMRALKEWAERVSAR